MIKVDVRVLLNPNVEVIELDIAGSKISCKDLIDRCKSLLSFDGDYTLKHNNVFLHPIEYANDGDELVLSIHDGEQEE